MSDRRNHELFRRFPLSGEEHISTGAVPTPYHIYDGNILFIGATADFRAVSDLLANEQVKPLQTTDGQALVGVWICDFTEASLGAHHELQISVFVSPRELPPIPAHPLAILKLILLNPDVKMLCHGLWNNTESVVAYNRELLGLNGHLMNGYIQSNDRVKSFSLADASSGAMLVEGQVRNVQRQSMGVGVAMSRLLGLSGTMQAARQPWLSLPVVNPVGLLPYNGVAQTYTKNDGQVVAYFDPSFDALKFGDRRYQKLNIMPHFVNHAHGCHFVYLQPQEMPELSNHELQPA